MRKPFLRPVVWIASLALVAVATASFPARAADLEERLTACSALKNPAERLGCFDRIARSLAGPSPGESSSAGSQWRVERLPASGGSGEVVLLKLPGDREARGKEVTALPLLVVRCAGGEMAAYVETGMAAQPEYGGDDRTVLLRFDDDEFFKDRLPPLADGKALGFWSAQMLVDQLMLHETLYFQFTPQSSRPASTTFVLEGLAEAFGTTGKACGFVIGEDGLLTPAD